MSGTLFANDSNKIVIKNSMNLIYNETPSSVNSISDMFEDGIFYGRFRSNSFYWNWKNEIDSKTKDHKSMGIGGSLIYKSARYSGFSTTLGLYTSQNPDFFRMDRDDIKFAKAAKDTFSRYDIKKGGHYGMSLLAQAYIDYRYNKTNLIIGRQLFHSLFTKSNDTKMVPNTFDGITISNRDLSKTTLRFAYFKAQKLRDHTSSHDVITFQDSSGESWNNNDDSAVHKGLSYSNFKLAGKNTDHALIILDAKNRSIQNIDITLSYLALHGVIQDIATELHYKIPLSSGWAIRPGFRYFIQLDDGGGAVAGNTNLKGKSLVGYSSGVEGSLDSNLFAIRVDALMPDKRGFFRFGYSDVADKADIVAPWRGFPTGGFTRAMGQYNWYANTKTYLLRAVYKFNSKFSTSLRYAIQDFDDDKINVQADSTVWHLDSVTKLTPKLQMKTRVGIVSSDIGNSSKLDLSYKEYRLEFNYLF